MRRTLRCLLVGGLLIGGFGAVMAAAEAAGFTTFQCSVSPMCNITVYNVHGVPVTNFLVPTGQKHTPTRAFDAGFSYCVTDRPGLQMLRRDCAKYSVTHWRSLRPGSPGLIDVTK